MTWRQRKHKKRSLGEENEVVREIRVDFWFLQSSATNSVDWSRVEGCSAKGWIFFQGGEGGNQHRTSEEKCLIHLSPAPPHRCLIKNDDDRGIVLTDFRGRGEETFKVGFSGRALLGLRLRDRKYKLPASVASRTWIVYSQVLLQNLACIYQEISSVTHASPHTDKSECLLGKQRQSWPSCVFSSSSGCRCLNEALEYFRSCSGSIRRNCWITLFSLRVSDLCWALAKVCVCARVCARTCACLRTCRTAAKIIPGFFS